MHISILKEKDIINIKLEPPYWLSAGRHSQGLNISEAYLILPRSHMLHLDTATRQIPNAPHHPLQLHMGQYGYIAAPGVAAHPLENAHDSETSLS